MKYCAPLFLLCLSACALSSGPEPTHYQLDPEAFVQATPHHGHATDIVHVILPRAQMGLDSTAIQVEEQDSRVTVVKGVTWVEAPEKMLEPLMVRALENSGLFLAVVGDDSSAAASYELQTSLERFTLVKTNDDAFDHVDVALRLTVTKIPDNRLITSRLIEVSEPIGELRMTNVITAFQKALQGVLAQFIKVLQTNLPRP